MGMDQVRPEGSDGFHQRGELPEIADNAFLGDAEVLDIDTLFANCFHLLRDERGILAILATSDNENFHF